MKSSNPFKVEDTVYFQGKNMNENKQNYEKNVKEVLELFYNTIWITYRKNFPALLNEENLKNQKMSDYISDTGWGCMVRVGQMAFAEVLRRHLVENNKLNDKNKENLKEIISGFLDDDEKSSSIAPYSIQKISKKAKNEFQLLPGEWYTPIRICYILGILHNNVKCMPGTEDLKVAVFSSSRPIVFEDFLERMCKVDHARGKHASICGPECREIKQKQQINCEQNNHSINGSNHQNIELKKSNSDILVIEEKPSNQRLVCPIHHELQFSMVVYIVCLIGLDSPQQEYLTLALKMMDFKYSVGLIGGKPKKALYFLGRVEEDLIYLDPHYVQEFSNQNNFQQSSQLDTYFCKKFQTFSSKSIDSSFSLMFYLKDLEQLEEFYQFMMGLKREYKENFFMMLEDKEPDFCQGDGNNSSNLISEKNIEKQQQKQIQKLKASQSQNQPNIDDVEDVGDEYDDNQHSNKNGSNGQNKNNQCNDDDDFEVIDHE